MEGVETGVADQRLLGFGGEQKGVGVALLFARGFREGFLVVPFRETADGLDALRHRLPLGRRQGAVSRPDARVRQHHRPAVFQEFRRRLQRELFAADRARPDDAVLEARGQLAEEDAAPVAGRDPEGQVVAPAQARRFAYRIRRQDVDQVAVEAGQLADMLFQDAERLRLHDQSVERQVQTLEPLARRRHLACRVDAEIGANRLRHRRCPGVRHRLPGGLVLLYVLRVHAPAAAQAGERVAVVAPVVGVPAQHAPQLLPGQHLAVQRGGGQFPRGGRHVRVQLCLGEHALGKQKRLHPRNPLARRPDVPPLAAESPPLACQAVVRLEQHHARPQNPEVHLVLPPVGRHRPSDGGMPHVQMDAQRFLRPCLA